MEFVDRLAAVLEARGWTPYQWAQRAELSDATVANMISRRAKGARPQTLRALAKTAAVSFEWLASGEGASGLDRAEPHPFAPDDHAQPPAAEGSPLERALGDAFDPKRHTVTDLRAVQDALGATHRWERPEADLLAAARTWLDSAAALRREGQAVDAVALLDRVTFGKTSRAREVATEIEQRVNDEADAELRALGLVPPPADDRKDGSKTKRG